MALRTFNSKVAKNNAPMHLEAIRYRGQMGYHLSDHYIQVESIESIKHFSEKNLQKKGGA